MYTKKVDIPRLNTTNLKILSQEETNILFKEYQQGNKEAKEKLVNGNIKLVLSILRRFHTTHDNINDLFQIGCIGLIKAIDNFDLSVGVCFSTYAVPLIIGEMRRANRDQSSIRVSRGIKDIAYKILDYKEKYFNLKKRRELPMKKFFTMAAQEVGQRVAQSVAKNPKAAVATALTVGKTVGGVVLAAAPYLLVGAAVAGAIYAATKE